MENLVVLRLPRRLLVGAGSSVGEPNTAGDPMLRGIHHIADNKHQSMNKEKSMCNSSRILTFDVNEATLTSLQEDLPEFVFEVVNGATADTLARDWNPGT